MRFIIAMRVTAIGGYAFADCETLASITVPGSVKTIENNAFDGCTNLRSVKLGDGVEEIGQWVFSYCSSLRKVTFPGSVVSIADNAFYKSGSVKLIVEEGSFAKEYAE